MDLSPSYKKTGAATYKDYIDSEDFQNRRSEHKRRYPKSYYCYVCDCTGSLNWHHIDYSGIPKEHEWNDLVWVCSQNCNCGNKCHFFAHTMVYKSGKIEKIDLLAFGYQAKLTNRLKQLRRLYEKQAYGLDVISLLRRKLYRFIW